MAKMTRSWLMSSPEVLQPAGRIDVAISPLEATEQDREKGLVLTLRLSNLEPGQVSDQFIELYQFEVDRLCAVAVTAASSEVRLQLLRLLLAGTSDKEILDSIAAVRRPKS